MGSSAILQLDGAAQVSVASGHQPRPEGPGANPDTSCADRDRALGIHDLQGLLEKRVAPVEAPTQRRRAKRLAAVKGFAASLKVRRAAKSMVGVGIAAVFGVLPLRTLLQTSSVEAIVNARVVTLRAPIDGEVAAFPGDLFAAGVVPQGASVLHIVNQRADRTRLNDLRRQRDRLLNERKAVAAKLSSARAHEAELDRQAEQFRLGRIEQLGARVAELDSLAAVAAAQREDALAAQDRAAALSRTGSVATAALGRLKREALAALQSEAATRHRYDASAVELTAARKGVFIGDSYNDRPSSVQRGDETRQRIADLTIEQARLDDELAGLKAETADEGTRFKAASDVVMSLPVAGRLWELMVSPGEQVRMGQDLVRLIDCSAAVITANVTEAVYNRLSLGGVARFVPADGGRELTGKVLSLTGLAGAPANLAIEPGALSKEPYRVTVSVPDLVSQQDCSIGRTGRVVFVDQAGSA